ncbi:MAG: hypothetical protein RIA71_16120 [Oceanicaulis sp.]
MILSRISHAVRTQNWFAVALEFVIVIAGVVIGFQVSAWNEQREAVARAEVLTVRLIEDMRAERWRVAGVDAYNAQVAANARRAVEALEGRRTVGDETLVIEAFRATQIYNFATIRATYDELVATGTINLIADPALIAAATEYYSVTSQEGGTLDPDRPYRRAFFELADQALFLSLADSCGESPDIMIGDYAALPQFLDFPCEIDGHDAEIAALAERLRESDVISPLLRHRAIEAAIESRNQRYWQDMFQRILDPLEAAP